MATLNPQSLVTLWQIEQYGSFSATAKATGWSQPAISQQIKKLEAQCGSTLVQRTSHGVELTATGSMLARHGEAIADRLERAAREVEDYRHHRFDHLHLVAPPSICSTIAARTVVKLSMFTDIELSLIQMEPPEAIGLISQGKADTAAVFRYSSIPNFLHIGDDLTFHSLGYDPMRLLVRRSSGIAKRFEETGEPVPLSAAKDEHWIAGCPTCRAEYRKALRTYFEGYKDQLCETCNSRLERNPMRILDCKSPVCGEIAKGAPKSTDYLCDDCRAHFEKVQTLLKSINIPFSIDPGLVRGLDSYTRRPQAWNLPLTPPSCADWIITPAPCLSSPRSASALRSAAADATTASWRKSAESPHRHSASVSVLTAF